MADSGMGRGAVAAGHPLSVQAAHDVLADGGNAFDACLAAALMACVAEPVFASLGGGGVMLVRTDGRQPWVYDFFADTPRIRRREAPLDWVTALSSSGMALGGGLASVATPGAVAGIFAIHRDLGRMPLADIASPAIAAAKSGIPVSAFQAQAMAMVESLLRRPACGGLFLDPAAETDTRPPLKKEGSLLRNRDLAQVLDALVCEGPDLFYQGEIGLRLIDDCLQQGGHLTREDLRDYHLRQGPALLTEYAGSKVFTAPWPSLSGVQIAHALSLLDGLVKPSAGWGSPAHWRLIAEALSLTHELADQIEDPGNESALTPFFDPDRIAQARLRLQGKHPVARRGTTHISVMDGRGNAASLTLSNGEGAGYVIPRTGIMMNNFLSTLERAHDERPWWMGRSRLVSLLAPTLVMSSDGVESVLGSGGSSRIRSAVLQCLVNLLDFGLPAEEAVCRPRLHLFGYGADAMLAAEGEIPAELRQRWPQHRQMEDLDMAFGGVHLVQRTRSGMLTAVGDPRRAGCSARAS